MHVVSGYGVHLSIQQVIFLPVLTVCELLFVNVSVIYVRYVVNIVIGYKYNQC